ncbi:MAG: ThiF family adenylyltransferase [Chloroflexi bacterium]|nr:MAG: ThiF family adenylyltransferase [Chloroflexota bacterium]
MPTELINHSADLKKLRDEGIQVEVRNGLLLVSNIPYCNSNSEVMLGTIVSELTLVGEKTAKPKTHVVHFIGEYPCNKNGSPIEQIRNQSQRQEVGPGIFIDHSFSNKPASGYSDYYEKIGRYISIISAPAKSIDGSATEKVFAVLEAAQDEEVFNYIDTNSSRAGIFEANSKLEGQKIAIIGLGGTGSYVLDLVAKTSVSEIHLFDGDDFLQHNAFRSPGAPSIGVLRKYQTKVHYFQSIYLDMHRNIYAHAKYVTEDNIDQLADMDFVFINVDDNKEKGEIITKLISFRVTFIDVGMGVQEVDGSLLGILRVTTSTENVRDHIPKRISFGDGVEDEYSTNIQIAELNALNAALAVLKWKQLNGFYQDFTKAFNTTYTINTGQLFHEDEV